MHILQSSCVRYGEVTYCYDTYILTSKHIILPVVVTVQFGMSSKFFINYMMVCSCKLYTHETDCLKSQLKTNIYVRDYLFVCIFCNTCAVITDTSHLIPLINTFGCYRLRDNYYVRN